MSCTVQLSCFLCCVISCCAHAVSPENCQCICESVIVFEESTNPTVDQDKDYVPRWFKENCTQSSTEAARRNLFQSLGYLKHVTTDILSQTTIEYNISLNKSCLPSSTLNVTQFDRDNISQSILKDISRMATFVNRLKMNNQPESSPNRSRQSVAKLFDDDREYHFLDHILHQIQCYLRNILFHSTIVENVHNLARVNWDRCHWGCQDDRCQFREIMIINHLKLIASSSLQLLNIFETVSV